MLEYRNLFLLLFSGSINRSAIQVPPQSSNFVVQITLGGEKYAKCYHGYKASCLK